MRRRKGTAPKRKDNVSYGCVSSQASAVGDQIPPIAKGVSKDGNSAIGFGTRRLLKADPGIQQARVIACEVVGFEKEPHAPCPLLSDCSPLRRIPRLCENEPCAPAGRGYPNPALVPLVNVFGQLKAKLAAIMGNGGVVVRHDQGEGRETHGGGLADRGQKGESAVTIQCKVQIRNQGGMALNAAELSTEGWALAHMLVRLGLEGASQEEILEAYCTAVLDTGLPILRVHVAQRAYHPEFGGFGFDWLRKEGLGKETYAHQEQPRDVWLRSPLFWLLEQDRTEMHADLRDPEACNTFDIFQDFRAQGATGYFAVKVAFAPRTGSSATDPLNPEEGFLMSWTTDAVAGFTVADLALLRGLTPFLGLALKSAANRQMASDIVSTYLGADAGERVLSGEITRGSSETIGAVIWYFDLEGFTRLSEEHAGAEVIALLNAYFGEVVEVVEGHGGNVLKLMGDGLLAIFDLSAQPDAVDQAVAAALVLDARLATLAGARVA